jgi:hypothetical protein
MCCVAGTWLFILVLVLATAFTQAVLVVVCHTTVLVQSIRWLTTLVSCAILKCLLPLLFVTYKQASTSFIIISSSFAITLLTMASKKVSSAVSQLAIQEIRREIFGHAPVLNIRSGFQELKKPHTGPYLARYYFDNDIDSAARKVRGGIN